MRCVLLLSVVFVTDRILVVLDPSQNNRRIIFISIGVLINWKIFSKALKK